MLAPTTSGCIYTVSKRQLKNGDPFVKKKAQIEVTNHLQKKKYFANVCRHQLNV